MKTNYDFYDRKTPEMVAALRQLWLDLAEVERLEPGLGHYPHNLDFGPGPGEMSSSFTDNSGNGNGKHWHFAPDQYYFQAQGVSPLAPTPAKAEPRTARTLRNIISWCLFLFFLGELALLFWSGVL